MILYYYVRQIFNGSVENYKIFILSPCKPHCLPYFRILCQIFVTLSICLLQTYFFLLFFLKVGPNRSFYLIEITEHTIYINSCLHGDLILGPLGSWDYGRQMVIPFLLIYKVGHTHMVSHTHIEGFFPGIFWDLIFGK